MMKKDYGPVHGIAECEDCPWKSESYKNIQAVASTHARAKSHRVKGEIGHAFIYDGRST